MALQDYLESIGFGNDVVPLTDEEFAAVLKAGSTNEEVAADFAIRNEQERAALRQQYAATRAMYTRWQHDLLAGVPSARIVELPGASLFMFLSNEADVLREVRAFVAPVTGR